MGGIRLLTGSVDQIARFAIYATEVLQYNFVSSRFLSNKKKKKKKKLTMQNTKHY